jgi:radical SAM family protein
MREVTCIQMDITTHCDRRCPECCCGIGINRTLQHHPWEYFEHVAPFIYGIRQVNLFGGEPTMHPRFREFVPRFKELFGCEILSMATNGFLIDRYRDLMHHFDLIEATPYDEKNVPRINYIQLNAKHTHTYSGYFVPRNHVGGGNPCHRASCYKVAYADGKFWPCVVGPGLDDATGFEPCFDWREKIEKWPMPCSTCFLSEPRGCVSPELNTPMARELACQ